MDTPQQRAALRFSRAARAVRRRYPAGTRVQGRVGGQHGTVVRHIPMRDAQGGVLVVDWDNGTTGRTQPASIELEPVLSTCRVSGHDWNGKQPREDATCRRCGTERTVIDGVTRWVYPTG